MTAILPVLSADETRSAAVSLMRRHRRALLVVLGLHALATIAALIGPRILGGVIEAVERGSANRRGIDVAVLLFAGALAAQTLLTRWARLRGAVLSEDVLAGLRETFVSSVLGLPLDVAERAGTGDLLTRATTDGEQLTYALRRAVPEILVAVVTVTLTLVALLVVAPVLVLPCLAALPLLLLVTRWYRRRAPEAYRIELERSTEVIAGLAETVDAGRTIEAHGLGERMRSRTDEDVRNYLAAERYTLGLRLVWFPAMEVAYVVPTAGTLLFGGLLYARGTVSLAEVTTAVLYVRLLVEPVDTLLSWLDHLQQGSAALARILGVSTVPAADESAAEPQGDELEVRDVCFAYREGHDVLHDVSLDVAPGSHVAVVGPSGAGKTTLGRLLAGIHAPRSGTVTVGGSEVARLATPVRRTHVALVTQEQHVFAGTLRDNLALVAPHADDTELMRALDVVDAGTWVRSLPHGLDTAVGGRAQPLDPAQTQQLALARLVLADPHTLVLDEATSLLDPRAARHLERSLNALLAGRTVVSIAHRLHTAHDADVVAVVEDGRVVELGSHDDLVAAAGPYAALWRSWHS